jgi:hypothetical protein
MPDPTNPNTPATTASNPMASAPSWQQFVSEYFTLPLFSTPFNGLYSSPTGMISPSYLNPLGRTPNGGGFGRGWGVSSDPNHWSNKPYGWDNLVSSGLLSQYGINAADDWRKLLNPNQPDRIRSAENILQQAFRDWQLRQMGQTNAPSTSAPTSQSSPDIAAMQPNSGLGVLQSFAQQMPITNPMASQAQPAPNSMQMAALVNAFAQPMQQYAPLNVQPPMPWMFQYL